MSTRARIIATYDGLEYDAAVYLGQGEQLVSLHSELPAAGFQELDGRYVRQVPLGDCDRLEYVRPVGQYRDLPVAVLDDRDTGKLWIESLAQDAPAANAAGLQRIERGVYRGWVPATQVLRQRLEVIDLNPSPEDSAASG